MATLLKLSNIAKTYNISKIQKQEVLKDISVELNRGEFVALVGESGCGKSTLINILGGLDSEYTGSVICNNQFLRDFNEDEMDDYRKKRVGLVFQNYNLIPHMTLIENIEISMHMSDIDHHLSKQRAIELLKMVGLDEYAEKYPNQLSGGQQQRVAIARALANNPSIILADEPTGALDKESEEIILKILRKIVESGKLVVVVTHSQLVASHCSRIIRIDEGVIVSDEVKYQINKTGKYEKVIMPKPIKTMDLAKLSFRNLKNKLSRSLIVSIGLSIGIAAMILILNLGLGLTNYVEEVYADSLQSTQLIAYYNDYSEIDEDEIDSINEIEGIYSIIETSIIRTADYSYGELSSSIDQIQGYYDDYYPTLLYGTIPFEAGSVLVNESIANELSDGSIISIIGTTITIQYDNQEYQFVIAGIYEDNSYYYSESNLYVYDEDLQTLNDDYIEVKMLYITLEDVNYINIVKTDLEALNFSTFQEEQSASSVLTYIEMGTKVLTGVSAISMIVAAIMIFIVLYISIVERTKEIGILRAIGARKKDISKMFIFEAGMIGFAGGVFGVVFSSLITLATNSITSLSLQTSLISYSVNYYLLGLVVSLIISVIAGIAPAVKAADLDPVVSLRYE